MRKDLKTVSLSLRAAPQMSEWQHQLSVWLLQSLWSACLFCLWPLCRWLDDLLFTLFDFSMLGCCKRQTELKGHISYIVHVDTDKWRYEAYKTFILVCQLLWGWRWPRLSLSCSLGRRGFFCWPLTFNCFLKKMKHAFQINNFSYLPWIQNSLRSLNSYKYLTNVRKNADDVENLKTFKNSSLKKHNLLKMYSTSGYPRRRWVYLI